MTGRLRLALTSRDLELLEVLCRKVRVLSLPQIVRTWWNQDETLIDAARQRLDRLRGQGFVVSRQALVRNIGPLSEPMVAWHPSQPIPQLGAAAWRLQCRWSIAPTVTTIYLATPRCARLFGGRRHGRVSRVFQVSHDHGVAEMFLAVRRLRPWAVPLWIDEDRFAEYRRGEKLPDAVLARNSSQVPELVLEFGAGYSKSRLQAFHDDNQIRGLPYEIW